MTRCGVTLLLCALFGILVNYLLAWFVVKAIKVMVWLM